MKVGHYNVGNKRVILITDNHLDRSKTDEFTLEIM